MSGRHVAVYVICCLHLSQPLEGLRSLIIAQCMSSRPRVCGVSAAICIETVCQTSVVVSACAEDLPIHACVCPASMSWSTVEKRFLQVLLDIHTHHGRLAQQVRAWC